MILDIWETSEIDEEDDEEEVNWWDVFEICECGAHTIGETCGQCGMPLCPMCFECGCGFCSQHPDKNFKGY